MSTESLKEFNRGLDIAESVIAQYPHGAHRDAILMKFAEAKALAEALLGSSIEVPSSGMASRMS